jgi:hypothetical protein
MVYAMPKRPPSEEDIQKIIRSLKGSKARGVTVMAPDGRLFYLTEAQARRAAFVDRGGAYAKFLAKARRGTGAMRLDAGCGILKRWLDDNNPNTRKWREISLIWDGRC